MKKFKLTKNRKKELKFLYSLVNNCPKFNNPDKEEIKDYFIWSETGKKNPNRKYCPIDVNEKNGWSGWNNLMWSKEWVGRSALIKKQFNELQRKDYMRTKYWAFAVKDPD